MMQHKRLLTAILVGLCALCVQAQLLDEMFTENCSLDSLTPHSLRIEVEAAGFFHDNEYQSEWQSGYTLPGVRIIPHLAYNPLSRINIEAGASMLLFNGANRYPNFAYHDIATWKGNQYQSGCHILPWVRLQASLKHLDIVVGNIYGGANHGIIMPLFNPEQNLSADPEMGFQLRLHRPHILLDTWMNWQSYIFETDSHQEAFTVGSTARILWGKRKEAKPQKTLSFYSPVQLVIQHRGGEQDETKMGVQTLCNASAGAGMRWNSGSKLDYLDAQLNAMASYQQAGMLWPFELGFAWHAGLNTHWFRHLNVGLDYQHAPKQFVSLYGNPFFSTVSLKNGGTRIQEDGSLRGEYAHQYEGTQVLRLGVDYQYTFAKAYTLGAAVEAFSLHSGPCLKAGTQDHTGAAKRHELNFSFGIYFRVSPSILLKKF